MSAHETPGTTRCGRCTLGERASKMGLRAGHALRGLRRGRRKARARGRRSDRGDSAHGLPGRERRDNMPTVEATVAGRTALVTGGSRGIGLAIAEALARAGARVALAARHADEVEAAAASLRA